MRAMKLLAAMGLVLCAGCAGLGEYAKDRGNDLLDCFQAHAGIGWGADIHARITRFLASGAGCGWSLQWGLNGRDFVGSEANHVGPPITTAAGAFGLALVPLLPEKGFLNRGEALQGATLLPAGDVMIRGPFEGDGGPDLFGARQGPEDSSFSILGVNLVPLGLAGEIAHRPKEPRLLDSFTVEVGGTALVLSLRLGFSPGQFADFVVGLFGLDIAGDDKAPEKEPSPLDKTPTPSGKQKGDE